MSSQSGIIKMQGEVPDDESETNGDVSYNLLPNNREKTLRSMRALRTVKRITFNPSEANPGHTVCPRAQTEQEQSHCSKLSCSDLRHRPFWGAR